MTKVTKIDKEKVKVKQFHELSECELNDLRQQMYERAVKENRELLVDVRCIYLGDSKTDK